MIFKMDVKEYNQSDTVVIQHVIANMPSLDYVSITYYILDIMVSQLNRSIFSFTYFQNSKCKSEMRPGR